MPRPRHPVLTGTPPATFSPEAAGKIAGYAPTPDAFARQVDQLRANSAAARAGGKLNRTGVPNGWAGRKAEIEALRAKAAEEGWGIARAAYSADGVSMARLDAVMADPMSAATDDEYAAISTAGILAIAFSPVEPTKLRVQALSFVMAYLRPKPANRRAVTLDWGLDWLRELAGETETA